MLSLLSLHFVNVALQKMIVERIAIDHPYITHETGSVVFPICTQDTPHVHQPRQHGVAWILRLRLREHMFPLAKWIDTLYL